MSRYIIGILLCLAGVLHAQTYQVPKREFRAAWIQCVNGQFQNIGTVKMQQTLTYQLDELQKDGANAIIFQVRPACDALYQSNIEPWSHFLTGVQGKAPYPYWDPLQWMIDQCHKRGMELHAWINPYRAKTKSAYALAPGHICTQHPERAFEYDGLMILNPALQENRDYICTIVEDILKRYDVDGLHIDDYFYPYPVPGVTIPDGVQFSYQAVMGDYADIPLKQDRLKKLKEDKYYNALQVKFAYAATCHKAQGGQWAHVYVDQGYMTDEMLTPDYIHWLYTAFTRATEQLYLVNWPKTQTCNE